ncbi:acetyltransferase [Niallia sp. Krafla_26]|uniref:acetyltransferase n=1 Tax=Niallia sp. Krafla_26 TaxID=3064703 RepID=UPI003D170F92
MNNKLLIIGASGHGKVVADIALKMSKWNRIAFVDDNESLTSSMGFEIVGKTFDAFNYIDEYDIFVAIGDNRTRETLQKTLEIKEASIPTLIHPSAVLGEEVELESGTVIMAGAVVNCCTKIGKGCIINTGVTIDHDNVLEDFVHVSPGAHVAGTVKVGKGSWLGVGCTIKNNVSITAHCMVGAGATIVKDITDPGTYIGVPARRV